MGLSQPRRIHIDIDELVFDGVAQLDRDRVAVAFEQELTRLLAQRGRQANGRGLVAADADRVVEVVSGLPPLPAATSSRRLGQVLARAVHDGLTRATAEAGDTR